ncbi:MAG: DUF2189 domain-containing protein [Parvibaculaceae bacterium]
MASSPGKTLGAAGESTAYANIRKISTADLVDALTKGVDDFKAKPSHLVILAILYPLAMVVSANIAAGYIPLPLVFPLLSGFALIGPLAAIGLYEISRRREQGLDISWEHAFNVIRRPSFSLVMLSILLGLIYFAWLGTAFVIYEKIYGGAAPGSITAFIGEVVTTSAGWTLIIVGCGVGFLFAVLALAISAVSFPMLLDRHVSMGTAVQTSIHAFLANPTTMMLWGFIVAGLLLIGSAPLFAGLAVVMPVLGHATWHLYRRLVTHWP